MVEILSHSYLVSKNNYSVAGSNECLPIVRGGKGKSLLYLCVPKETITTVRQQLQFQRLEVSSLSVPDQNAGLACAVLL